MGRLSKEDRMLLVKDLCARLPYGVLVECDGIVTRLDNIWLQVMYNSGKTVNDIEGNTDLFHDGDGFDIEKIKPYLRPMESMTEDEANDYFKNSEYESSECYEAGANYEPVTVKAACSADEAWANTDWLNARHFDYRGLIPKGLALEAKEGEY